jgi:hypothetical protein
MYDKKLTDAVTVTEPFSFLEMDIKYVYIKGLHLDVFLSIGLALLRYLLLLNEIL